MSSAEPGRATRAAALVKVVGALDVATRAQVAELARRVEEFDGVEAISEAPRLALAAGDPAQTHFLAWRGDRLAGYAQLEAAGRGAELAVSPDSRRLGVGAALVGDLARSAVDLRIWAHGDLLPARACAAALGLAPVREMWEMAAGMRPGLSPAKPPSAAAPASATPPESAAAPASATPPEASGTANEFTFRRFDPARDRAAWVGLNALAFAGHPEQGALTLADLDRRMALSWFDKDGLIVAEPRAAACDDTSIFPAPDAVRSPLAGYVWTKIEAGRGEIYGIGVHPAAQGRRLGTRLLELGLQHLAGRGVHKARLFVEGDNAPAIAAYRRQGFRVIRRDVQYAFPPGALPPMSRRRTRPS
ncbi:MAG: GNAT family N-acetyltransferase [Bifidobacteriaceae bacterium]|nr:GNAT family N-acetyltransferase [Bifidobacteriaceae bacterium]